MANIDSVTIDGVTIVNVTPHEIRFQAADGSVVVVPASGFTAPAEARQVVVRSAGHGLPELVTTKYVPSDRGWKELREIHKKHGDRVVIVGSIISAQAYVGHVHGLVPVPGRERAAPADKLFRADQFVVF